MSQCDAQQLPQESLVHPQRRQHLPAAPTSRVHRNARPGFCFDIPRTQAWNSSAVNSVKELGTDWAWGPCGLNMCVPRIYVPKIQCPGCWCGVDLGSEEVRGWGPILNKGAPESSLALGLAC